MPAPNLIICKECKEEREAHARDLCKTCYDRLYPGARPWGFCASPDCPRAMQYIELRARGLCPTCYERERKAGRLGFYPKKQEMPSAPVSTPGILVTRST